MEFLESTHFFVRVTVYDFEHKDEAIRLKFRLIPMIHVGEFRFYDSVMEKIEACDALIYEGIQWKTGTRLMNTRLKIAKELDLVLQEKVLSFKSANLELIHGDFTRTEADVAWRKVRWNEKLKDKIVSPFQRYYLARSITRMQLAKYFMKSYEESHLAYGPRFDEEGTTENFYMAAREQKVLHIISDKMQREGALDKTIGILYGAGHMHRFSRFLIDKQGFRVSHGEFLKVFDVY